MKLLDEKELKPDKMILSCPAYAVPLYEKKMKEKGISYKKRLDEGKICFILPKKYRPHAWKLNEQ